MISFSSLSFRGIAADGVLALFIFWRGYKTPLFRVLGSTMCCGAGFDAGRPKGNTILLGRWVSTDFHEKPRGGT